MSGIPLSDIQDNYPPEPVIEAEHPSKGVPGMGRKQMKKLGSEKGQSLVLVALLLVAFMALLALVLDGANTYFQRRNAQNAADAGALAGADTLCNSHGDTGQAVSVALNYAVDRNDADPYPDTTASATWYNPGGIVQVSASITFQTFFGQILGQNAITAAAYARAGCAPPSAGVGVLPIAWSCRPPDVGSESDDCDLLYMEGDECEYGIDPMYIIVDDDTIEDDILCQDPPNSGDPPGALDCDFDGDGINDLMPLSGGNRSWLDLDGGGGGANDLNDWVEFGFPGTIAPHTWFAGQTGAIADVYGTVHQTQLHNQVVIPIFDDVCPDGVPSTACPGKVHPEDTIVVSGGSSTDYFHVISFSYFHPECVDAQSYGPCAAHDYLVDQGVMADNTKTIEGCFVDGFVPGIGGEPGSGIDAGVYTIFLMD